ncbi:MAG: N-acetylmuramoyl-L-alanine amidase [Deltaproteobacteria bacterium]|nr:N-acetylmuramoyl-L-alanine amidase [Deltaproteobacteria bacterium]
MGKHRPSGKLIIGGQAFDTDAPIVNFREGPRWDATQETLIPTETDPNPFAQPGAHQAAPGKWTAYDADHKNPNFTARCQGRPALRHKWNNGMNAPYESAKQVIRQFMIHHDGCASADMCFSVAQNERGLSVHFLCDNDGTIYQTLDLALEGWHGSELNSASIGVELCNRGDAFKEPNYYAKKGGRDVKPCKINNHTIKSFDFTRAQYDSMKRLSRALLRLLPNLPAEYPQSSPGVQTWNTVGYGGMSRFNGYLGHYHLTDNKWDPGPFDFKDFCQGIRGAFSFPLFPRGVPKKDRGGANQLQPVVPDQSSAVKEEAEMLYALNEAKADGGFFPVGPWGEARLWHGGIHIAPPTTSPEGSRVFAPFPGRLVAARMGPPSAIGSTNFVLLRHQMSLSDRKLEFYSLYMHLSDATKTDKPPEWLVKAREAKKADKAGEVWLLDEPVEAGAVIGLVGTAGPDQLAKPQVHIELFSISDLFEGMPGIPWETVDGTAGGRFCDAARITDIIDTNKDTLLSREELKTFYTTGGGRQMYYLVTRHVSEWTSDPPWAEALRQPKDFRDVKPAVIEALVNDQITPGLWWDERVATHAKLPTDGVVYHYHPISFVRWLNEKLIDAAAQAGPQAIDPRTATQVPQGVTDDREGGHMMSKDVMAPDECNDKLTLRDMVQGFEAPDCGGGTP